MSVPAADHLRRLVTRSAVVTQHEAAMRAVADLLDAIDALHQPHRFIVGVCRECGNDWPCDTQRLLHPEDGGQ